MVRYRWHLSPIGKMAIFLWVGIVLLLVDVVPHATAQQYPFIPIAGAPKNVKQLFQDSRGRLWVGGERLACFDGTRFFFLEDYGLPAGLTYAVAEDTGGTIWIGAETGVFRFSGGRVELITSGVAVSVVPVTPDFVVTAIGPLGKGFPAKSSLVRIQKAEGIWKAETVMQLEAPGPLTLDHTEKLLYVLPDKGWNQIRLQDIVDWRPGGQLSVQQNAAHDAVPALGPMRAVRDRAGCVWIGSDNGNRYNCGDDKWKPAPFEGASVRSDIQEGPDGTMLLVGYNILAVGRPGAFRIAKPVNGLPQLFVAIQALDGTIWLGGAGGLYRFASPFRMEYWTGRDGVDNPWAVQRVGANIYAGFDRDVAVLGKDRQHWQSIASFTKVGQVMNLLPVDDRNMLVALNIGGAVQLQTDGTVVSSINLRPSHYGLRLARTPRGDAWLGGLGLGRLVRAGPVLKFEDDHRFETRASGNVLDVQYERQTQKLWSCYMGGLVVRNEDATWREFTTKDGLFINPCWSLAALPNGDVWYGYYDTPAFARVRPKADGSVEVRHFKADEVKDPQSFTFDVDSRGWLWRGGITGLSVSDSANADAGRWLYLDQSDGLSGTGPNTGSYFADTDGSIWMGIDISVFHYLPPADLLAPAFSPKIFLSSISWDKNAPRFVDAIKAIPSGVNAIAHVGSLQFDRRHAIQVRYRVLPDQKSWNESSSLDLALGSLPPGSHTLEAQARVFTGPWSQALTRSFTVQPPFWRSTLFISIYIVVGCVLAFAIYARHQRNKEIELQLLPALDELRLKALSDAAALPKLLNSRFEIGNLIEHGGFAHVLHGYDRQQKQRCAVKIFREEVRDRTWIERRFLQEVSALESIHHPNVVSIYAHGNLASGAPFLVMEFIEGRNLARVLEDGALPIQRTAKILRQLGDALDAIHAQGIWHLDVKPENIVLSHEGDRQEAAVLIDFSLAIVRNANESLYYRRTHVAGTPAYMAPEQSSGYGSATSDIYSLAKVLIGLLTGKHFFELIHSAPPDLSEKMRELLDNGSLGVRLSEASAAMLASALEFDPARRPQHAGEFATMIAGELESHFPISGA